MSLLNKLVVFLRIIIGLLFVVSSCEKLFYPYQNFLYVVEGYQILPRPFEIFTAQVFPWIEFFVGLFLVFGLRLKWTLPAAILMVSIFLIMISQAMLRKIPIDECGCFGQLVSFPIYVTLILDSCLFVFLVFMLKNIRMTSRLSLDQYLDQK